MEMRYDLATNFEDNLIERVSEFGTVKSIYGKLAKDIVGGGRPSLVLPDISRRQLRRHIELAHKNSIKFNYLLNASCLDNKEFTSSFHKEFVRLVSQVKEDGADGVTVGSASILSMVKEQFPDLSISTSIYMAVDSLSKIKHFEKMGADQITLSHNFTRDFGLLEKALAVIDEKTELRLIANNICLHNCPYMVPSHANLLAHASQLKHETGGFIIDIYTMLCGLQKLKNPEEFLMSEWIRPEDVHYYEETCTKLNKDNLVLKLTDRARTTEWLANVVKAYAEKSYDGNLMDILNYIGNKGGYQQVKKGAMIKGALMGKANGFELMKLEKAIFLPEVYLDNRALEGFLEHFIKSPCNNKTCYTKDKPYGECKFCYGLGQKVIQIDESRREESIKKVGDLVQTINSGDMFR
jgi:collagenase-like PrtC family protease